MISSPRRIEAGRNERPDDADRETGGADLAIRIAATASVLAVAGIAAYVSYWHAYALVRAASGTGLLAHLEPFTVDGLVCASSMVTLYAARHQLHEPRLTRWTLAIGIVASLVANGAQGHSGGSAGRVAIASWPPLSLVLSYEQLQWIVRSARKRQRSAHVEPLQVLATGDDAEQDAAYTVQPDVEADLDAAAVAVYRFSVNAGRPLSERKLAEMFGKTSRRWARSRIAEGRSLGTAEPAPMPSQAGNGNSAPISHGQVSEEVNDDGKDWPVIGEFELAEQADRLRADNGHRVAGGMA